MRRTKEDAEKTRLAILDSSVTLFATKGVAHTSMEDIATAANVTRGAVYWHFNNKGEIFDALHDQMFMPVTAMILEDLKEETDDPLLQLQNLCVRMILDLEDNCKQRQALSIFIMGNNYVGEMAQYKEKHYGMKTQSIELFRSYFEKAQKKNALPEGACPELLTYSVRFFMKGIIVEYLNGPCSCPLSDFIPRLMAQFFKQFE